LGRCTLDFGLESSGNPLDISSGPGGGSSASDGLALSLENHSFIAHKQHSAAFCIEIAAGFSPHFRLFSS
jgi:hypothetical protein